MNEVNYLDYILIPSNNKFYPAIFKRDSGKSIHIYYINSWGLGSLKQDLGITKSITRRHTQYIQKTTVFVKTDFTTVEKLIEKGTHYDKGKALGIVKEFEEIRQKYINK